MSSSISKQESPTVKIVGSIVGGAAAYDLLLSQSRELRQLPCYPTESICTGPLTTYPRSRLLRALAPFPCKRCLTQPLRRVCVLEPFRAENGPQEPNMSEVTVTDGGWDRNVHEPLHRGRNSAYQPMSALIKSNVVVNVLYGF